jgi:cytidine deaminase
MVAPAIFVGREGTAPPRSYTLTSGLRPPTSMQPNIQMLIDLARPLVGEMTLGRPDMSASSVAAAILTSSGHTYTGVCVHVSCGIGFCAEHAAVAEMLKARETEIEAIVAVCEDGVLPPCGRCRELLVQVNPRNLEALVALPGDRVKRLRELLPDLSFDCRMPPPPREMDPS